MNWKYYFPDNEDASCARDLKGTRYPVDDAEDAARFACEMDYSKHDGWERGDREFAIAVISPSGEEHRFTGQHEPSVEHRVYECS